MCTHHGICIQIIIYLCKSVVFHCLILTKDGQLLFSYLWLMLWNNFKVYKTLPKKLWRFLQPSFSLETACFDSNIGILQRLYLHDFPVKSRNVAWIKNDCVVLIGLYTASVHPNMYHRTLLRFTNFLGTWLLEHKIQS